MLSMFDFGELKLTTIQVWQHPMKIRRRKTLIGSDPEKLKRSKEYSKKVVKKGSKQKVVKKGSYNYKYTYNYL